MVISNSSPLINLSGIGQLNLLKRLYRHIDVPIAVWNEVVVKGSTKPRAVEISDALWIRKQHVVNTHLVTALQQSIHAGEAEAIALAVERKARLLLIDDAIARDIAQGLGLNCVGILGILREAKHKKLVGLIKPILNQLRGNMGFWISDELYRMFLASMNEQSDQLEC